MNSKGGQLKTGNTKVYSATIRSNDIEMDLPYLEAQNLIKAAKKVIRENLEACPKAMQIADTLEITVHRVYIPANPSPLNPRLP